MKFVRFVFALSVVAVLAACATVPKAHVAPITLKGDAVGGAVFVTATLCSGEFECAVAPYYTHGIVANHKAEAAFLKNAMTRADAEAVHDHVVQMLALLDQAKVACAQNMKTGQCTGDVPNAHALLDKADTLSASLP